LFSIGRVQKMRNKEVWEEKDRKEYSKSDEDGKNNSCKGLIK